MSALVANYGLAMSDQRCGTEWDKRRLANKRLSVTPQNSRRACRIATKRSKHGSRLLKWAPLRGWRAQPLSWHLALKLRTDSVATPGTANLLRQEALAPLMTTRQSLCMQLATPSSCIKRLAARHPHEVTACLDSTLLCLH